MSRRYINWTNEKINFIIEQYTSKKMNTKELGKYFNCSSDTICRKLKEQGIYPKKFYEDLTGQYFGKLYVLNKSLKSNRKIYWDCLCECGNFTTVVGDNLRQGKTMSCGKCHFKSQGEFIITNLLKNNNILFQREYKFDDLISNYHNMKYRFDFAIFQDQKLQYLIEYDGEQHFKKFAQESGWCNKENFIKTQHRDEIKNQYCEQNKIPLIRIPYTQLSKLTINDLLLETTNFRKV